MQHLRAELAIFAPVGGERATHADAPGFVSIAAAAGCGRGIMGFVGGLGLIDGRDAWVLR